LALEDEGAAFTQELGELLQLYNQKEQNPQLHHCKSFKTRIVWAARRMPFPTFWDCALEEVPLSQSSICQNLAITAFCDCRKLVFGRSQISARLPTI